MYFETLLYLERKFDMLLRTCFVVNIISLLSMLVLLMLFYLS